MIEQLIVQLPDWIQPGETAFNLLIQLATFVAVLLVAPLVQRVVVRQIIQRSPSLLQKFPTTHKWIAARGDFQPFAKALLPLFGYLLGRGAMAGFIAAELPRATLEWAVTFLLIWFAYLLSAATLQLFLKGERATALQENLVRPIIILLAIVHASGYLDEFFNLGFTLQDARVTLVPLTIGVSVLIFSVIISRHSRTYLSETLFPRAGMEKALSSALSAIAGYLIIVTGFMVGMGITGISLTTLTVIFGGLSVGIGFGLQEIISNFFAGFVLMFERSISPGDMIKIDDHVGWVQEINIRSMRVKTIQNVELVIPNNKLMSDTLINFTRAGDTQLRVDIDVFAHPSKNPRAVSQAVMEAAALHPQILSDPAPYVAFNAYNSNTLNLFTLEAWTDEPQDRDDIMSELRYKIWEALDQYNLGHPPPRRDLYIQSTNNGTAQQSLPPAFASGDYALASAD